ncbi:MAG: DinB family protein [Cytophagales bacterium]|nr:DinB family protein [Cytophagales bacterium]
MMKQVVLLFLIVMTTYTLPAQKKKLSESEIQFLEGNYQTSTALLEQLLEGLPDSQWRKRPAKGSWSIQETMEHVILAMTAQIKGLEKALSTKSDEFKDLRNRDGWLLSKIADRGVRVKTPLEPTGNDLSKEAMMEEYRIHGARFLDILRDKKTEFRNHYGNSPYGEVDAYQLMIFIPGHIQRHLSQMEEILRALES